MKIKSYLTILLLTFSLLLSDAKASARGLTSNEIESVKKNIKKALLEYGINEEAVYFGAMIAKKDVYLEDDKLRETTYVCGFVDLNDGVGKRMTLSYVAPYNGVYYSGLLAFDFPDNEAKKKCSDLGLYRYFVEKR